MAEAGEATAAPSTEQVLGWKGHRLDEVGGSHVGRIDGAFVAEGEPTARWLLARMGRFGHHTLVPARDAVEGVGRVWVPYSRDLIRAAPRVDPRAELTVEAERRLLDHYGISPDPGADGEPADGEAIAASRA